MRNFAIVKDGVVESVFTATPEWARAHYPDAVDVTNKPEVGRNFVFDGQTFVRPGRNLGMEKKNQQERIRKLLEDSLWILDQDAIPEPQRRTEWRQWRNSLRSLLRDASLNEDTPLPAAPGELDEG